MRTSSSIVWQNMTSHDTDEVIWGNIDDLTHNPKTSVNSDFYQKNLKNLCYGMGCCCIVFGENAISLNFRNGGKKRKY